VLEARWGEVEEFCHAVPGTVIHGDFVKKNLRVRQSAAGPVLLAFDWEYAGWGSPGIDLTQFTGGVASPDLAVYRSCVEDWPASEDDAQRLARCGRFFRVVDTMYWICLDLRVDRPEWLIDRLRELTIYSERMARALSEAGWTTS
jgi:hypothetical protein